MISVVLSITTIVASWAVMKANVSKMMSSSENHHNQLETLNKFMNEKRPLLEHFSKTENRMLDDISNVTKDVVALDIQIHQAPTMKEVREEFASKEFVAQMEKHIDEKFLTVNSGIEKILKNQDNYMVANR